MNVVFRIASREISRVPEYRRRSTTIDAIKTAALAFRGDADNATTTTTVINPLGGRLRRTFIDSELVTLECGPYRRRQLPRTCSSRDMTAETKARRQNASRRGESDVHSLPLQFGAQIISSPIDGSARFARCVVWCAVCPGQEEETCLQF